MKFTARNFFAFEPGTKATCKMCGAEIEYISPFWRHTGECNPPHLAKPAETEKKPFHPAPEASPAAWW